MIEDDPSIAAMYRLQLEVDGYDVRLASDGPTGLHLVQQAQPDLIVLDIRLPKLGGIELLRSIVADPRLAAIPVLILSNYSDAAIVREGLDLGAREYLVKSRTTPAELSSKIRSLLPAD